MAMQLAIKHLVLRGGGVLTDDKCGWGVKRQRNESQGETTKEELIVLFLCHNWRKSYPLSLCSPTHPCVDAVKIPRVLAHKWNVINCTDVQCTTANFSHFCTSENTPSTDTTDVTITLNIFLCPFICVCLCVHGRVCTHVCGCMCVCLEVRGWCWVSFSDVLHFVFETGCLIEQGLHWFVWTGWPANPSAGWVVSNHCQYRLEIQTQVLSRLSPQQPCLVLPLMLLIHLLRRCVLSGDFVLHVLFIKVDQHGLFFLVLFPSLGIIILGFTHIEVYSYFIISNCWEPCDYTTIWWIHLSMTYLSCLQAWIIRCSAALNFHGQSFVWTCASIFLA